MPRLKLIVVVLLLTEWVFARPAEAQPSAVIYVKAGAPPGGNGQSWTTAYNNLQSAISAAAAIPEATRNVWVFIAQGTYRPAPPNGSRAASFQLLKGTQYSGGYEGNPANPYNRDPVLFPTILSGDLNGDDNGDLNKADNSYHVVTASGTSSPREVLDLLTIRGGNANGSQGADQAGGGIFIENGTPYLNRLTLDGNTARVGGGIYSDGNSGTGLQVVASTFTGNKALGGESGIALNGGGAIALRGGSAQIYFSNFRANSSSQGGGAIRSQNTTTTITQSVINQNTSVTSGAGLRCDGPGSLAFLRCTLNGNSSQAGSSAVTQSGDSLTMVGCLVSGNVGSSAAVGASLGHSIVNCTISGNWGGGLFNGVGLDSVPRYFNSVFWGNFLALNGSQEQEAQVWNSRPDNFRSCILQNGDPQGQGSRYSIANPQFRISPTDPRSGNSATWGDCHLLATSPAVDSGSNAEYSAYFPFDLDGLPRFISGLINSNPNALATIDRGCFEYNPNCSTCTNERLWYNGLGGNWNDAANWVYGTPGPGNTARVSQQYGGAGQYIENRLTMSFSQSANLKRLVFESAYATLDLNGYALNLTDTQNAALTLGNVAQTAGDIIIKEGRVTATGVNMASVPGSFGNIWVTGPTAGLSVTQQDLYIGYAGSGTMLIDGGARVFARSPSIGDQPTGSGSLRISGPGSRMDVPIVTTVNNGSITLENGGTIQSPFGTVLFQNGVLTGDGVATGTTVNYGLVRPRGMTGTGAVSASTPGTLTIAGDYAQLGEISDIEGNTGRLSVRLIAGPAGTFLADRISVGQTATLAGTLLVEGPSALSLALNASTSVLDSATVNGRFDLASFPGLVNNRVMRLEYPPLGARGGSVSISVASLPFNINLNPPSTASIGGLPTGVVAAKLNNDDFYDLALTVPDANNPTTAPGQVIILINAGNSGGNWQGFQAAAQLTVNVGVNPCGLAAVNLNAGGTVDLVVANYGSNNLTVLSNNGTGAMTTAQTISVGTRPVAVAVDVRPEQAGLASFVAVANEGSNSVTVLTNSAGALGSPATLAAGDSPSDICAAMLDLGSSTVDLAVTNRNDNTVTVYYRPPSGGFSTLPSRTLPTGTQPIRIAPGAFNEPGGLDNPKDINDLAVVNFGGDSISLLFNNNLPGSGAGFLPKADLPAGTGPGSITPGDLDADGDLDISVVTTVGGERVVRIFRNDQQPLPGGGYQAAFSFFGDQYQGTQPLLVTSRDVNNDGRDDLIAVNEQTVSMRPAAGSGEMERMVTQSRNVAASLSLPTLVPPPCPWDLVPSPMGDGLVNTADLVAFLGQFGKTCAQVTGRCADFNNDGAINTADLVTFLGRFGQPCP